MNHQKQQFISKARIQKIIEAVTADQIPDYLSEKEMILLMQFVIHWENQQIQRINEQNENARKENETLKQCIKALQNGIEKYKKLIKLFERRITES